MDVSAAIKGIPLERRETLIAAWQNMKPKTSLQAMLKQCDMKSAMAAVGFQKTQAKFERSLKEIPNQTSLSHKEEREHRVAAFLVFLPSGTGVDDFLKLVDVPAAVRALRKTYTEKWFKEYIRKIIKDVLTKTKTGGVTENDNNDREENEDRAEDSDGSDVSDKDSDGKDDDDHDNTPGVASLPSSNNVVDLTDEDDKEVLIDLTREDNEGNNITPAITLQAIQTKRKRESSRVTGDGKTGATVESQKRPRLADEKTIPTANAPCLTKSKPKEKALSSDTSVLQEQHHFAGTETSLDSSDPALLSSTSLDHQGNQHVIHTSSNGDEAEAEVIVYQRFDQEADRGQETEKTRNKDKKKATFPSTNTAHVFSRHNKEGTHDQPELPIMAERGSCSSEEAATSNDSNTHQDAAEAPSSLEFLDSAEDDEDSLFLPDIVEPEPRKGELRTKRKSVTFASTDMIHQIPSCNNGRKVSRSASKTPASRIKESGKANSAFSKPSSALSKEQIEHIREMKRKLEQKSMIKHKRA